MPAYSFQERFVPLLKDGTKTRTIRKRRKKGYPKPGDTIYLYFGMRTKYCTKIAEAICTSVLSVFINESSDIELFDRRLNDIEADEMSNKLLRPKGKILSQTEANAFAWADGFRPEGSSEKNPAGAYDLMLQWWRRTHGLPFLGDVISWKF